MKPPMTYRSLNDCDTHTFFEVGMARSVTRLQKPPSGTGLVLNLGAGAKLIEGSKPLDPQHGWWASKDIPAGDETVSAVYAYHFLEHLSVMAFHKVMSEVDRVLLPGGVFNIVVPYGSTHLAVQDPDHKMFFNEDTWRTYLDNQYYETYGDRLKLHIGFNLVMGAVGHNLALFTQLIKADIR